MIDLFLKLAANTGKICYDEKSRKGIYVFKQHFA